MKHWVLLIPLMAAIYLISQSQQRMAVSQGVSVYFSKSPSTLAAEQSLGRSKSLHILEKGPQIQLSFKNLGELWERLPDSGSYFSGDQQGFQSFLPSSKGDRDEPSRPLKAALRKQLQREDLQFDLKRSRCHILEIDPKSYHCETNEKGVISTGRIGKIPVHLTHLSTVLYRGGRVDPTGERREVGVYAVHVGVRFGSQPKYEFTLFTNPSFVQAFYLTEGSPKTLAKNEK